MIRPFLILLTSSYAAVAAGDYLDAAGVGIHYIDEGHGEPVLLIHGYTGSIESWRRRGVIDNLKTAGYRVIAYDNRGHGLSDKPHDPGQYGLQMVEDTRRLLDHLGIQKAHVVGYSMGGTLACKFRELYPERLQTVTLGGFGWPHRSRQQPGVKQIQQMLKSRGLTESMDAEALVAYWRKQEDTNCKEASLKTNEVPALILVGEDDSRVMPLARSLADTMASSELKVVPGNHPTAHSSEEFMNYLLEFLIRHKP